MAFKAYPVMVQGLPCTKLMYKIPYKRNQKLSKLEVFQVAPALSTCVSIHQVSAGTTMSCLSG